MQGLFKVLQVQLLLFTINTYLNLVHKNLCSGELTCLLPQQCVDYMILDDYTRNVNQEFGFFYEDNTDDMDVSPDWNGEGWYVENFLGWPLTSIG